MPPVLQCIYCPIFAHKQPWVLPIGCISVCFSHSRISAPYFCLCVYFYLLLVSVGFQCSGKNFERFEVGSLSSVTVNIIFTCLVMQRRVFEPAVAFLCIIIAPEHFSAQIKADTMFAVTDYPAQEIPATCFPIFK